MKKFYILIAVYVVTLGALLASCKGPAGPAGKDGTNIGGYYSDSIIIDLFSYLIYSTNVNPYYYISTIMTAKGQSFLKPLDSIFKLWGTNYQIVPAIVPKYKPNTFEAWVYDSIPLTQTFDTLDTNLLAKVITFSSSYLYTIDTTSMNPFKGMQPIQGTTYNDGYGFVLGGGIGGLNNYWGIGKIKIYYK
jgi:hypothetical protein